MKLCMMTYLREQESITNYLWDFVCKVNFVCQGDFKLVIFCEKEPEKIVDVPIEIVKRSGTKYTRIKEYLQNDDALFYLSVDNDIRVCDQNFFDFLSLMMREEYDIGYGIIEAEPFKGFVSHLVSVDKVLSHEIIRPLLWKLKIGISIPGQLFVFKGDAFRQELFSIDTYLDDLVFGVLTNIHEKKSLFFNKTLGFERPNVSFRGLCSQRKRWAEGYASILKKTKRKKIRQLLLIHGFAYHMTWLVLYVVFVVLLKNETVLGIACFMFFPIFVCLKSKRFFLHAILYEVVFPFFHIYWYISLKKIDR